MRTKMVAAVAACLAVLALYYHGGFLNNLLLPGFYISALMTVTEHASFGAIYVVVGLVINAAIFALIFFWLFRGILWIRSAPKRTNHSI